MRLRRATPGDCSSTAPVSARPGFVIDATNAAAVGEICRRLDGIPLAIQLAAARLVAMTPTEIAGLLDERFRLLTGGRHAAVERHRTLRAAVDWSYGLLEPVEQLVFDRLGVFAGTFDAIAASAVISDGDLEAWDVIDGLSSLVAKSMLIAETGPADTTRYQMLETLRQHAIEHLDLAGDTDESRRRHAQHYARYAEEAAAALVGRDELAWRPRVDADRDNLRAAVYWALDRDDDDALLALRIIAALAYEAINDPPSGIGAWAERAVDTAVRSSARERRAVLATAAFEATNLAKYDLALSRAAAARLDGVAADSIAPGLLSFAENWFVAQQGDQLTAMRASCEAADELMRGRDGRIRTRHVALRRLLLCHGGRRPRDGASAGRVGTRARRDEWATRRRCRARCSTSAVRSSTTIPPGRWTRSSRRSRSAGLARHR